MKNSRVVCVLAVSRAVLASGLLALLVHVPLAAAQQEINSSIKTQFAPEDSFEEESALEKEIRDPLEMLNRGVFWFNDKFDVFFGEPVARGYDFIVPNRVQKGVSNFFDNLSYPSYLVSDLVQFKFTQAAEHTGRFLINSTVGLAGFIDVAKCAGLEKHQEDFGLALAYHGVPPGPYLVIPVLGPSNLRDGVGQVVDFVLHPFFWVSQTTRISSKDSDYITWGGATLQFVNTRARLLDVVEAAKEGSVDYYLFMQGAYYQYREGLLYDGDPPSKGSEWLDEDEFEEVELEPVQ